MSIQRQRHDKVEVITIDRPEARNSIDGAASQALSEAFDELESDDNVWVVILTGAGDKAFSAGMDLKAFAAGEGGAIAGAKGGFAGFVQRDFPKPIIAAVNGYALGGGLEIMLGCDLVVAAQHATFGLPEVKRGLIAGAGGLIRLPKRVPFALALEMAMTGESIDAKRALELGLINKVVPIEDLLNEALNLANLICANGPLAVRASKRVMRQAVDLPEGEGWLINATAVGEVFSSQDAQEGPIAFAQKRLPVWKGK
ncbi:MAG: crotonase/enoyl-CoA hydratase family protein [Actinobacteria bacterium]|jgi:enoyl-CoA hydratase/carnithine racemase|nr:crotonase/enoyl-CoA hydratase family protein [Actinomycetota bacterium]MCL6104918.1 crotonase/enoyl-CoA hydratase family protein [Actinomycetota bacterium]